MFSQTEQPFDDFYLKKINEPTLNELKERIFFKKVNDSLIFKSINDSLIYKGKSFKTIDFELFELKYQTAFGDLILYRFYGNSKKYFLLKKTLSRLKTNNSSERKLWKIDSSIVLLDKIKVDNLRLELEKFSFWQISKFKSDLVCLDGNKVKVSGLNNRALVEIESTNCMKEKELPVQLKNIFKEIFDID